jgi:hypothetical protein
LAAKVQKKVKSEEFALWYGIVTKKT